MIRPSFRLSSFVFRLFLIALFPSTAALAMEAAPDETPLVWDRARSFQTILIGSVAEGFEKTVQPQRGTNSVFVKVTVDKVLKGDKDAKEAKTFSLSVHDALPKLLAARDQTLGKQRSYLLIMQPVKPGQGYLGGGQLYLDLERVLPATPDLERVVQAFIDAKDDSKPGQIKLCADLLVGTADQKPIAGEAAAPVEELLARAAVHAEGAAWKTLAAQPLVDAVEKLMTQGDAPGTGASALLAIDQCNQRFDNPAEITLWRPTLKAPLRKWAADLFAKTGDNWPTLDQQKQMAAVARVLAKLQDQDAKDLLVKVGSHEKWSAIRRDISAALDAIFGRRP